MNFIRMDFFRIVLNTLARLFVRFDLCIRRDSKYNHIDWSHTHTHNKKNSKTHLNERVWKELFVCVCVKINLIRHTLGAPAKPHGQIGACANRYKSDMQKANRAIKTNLSANGTNLVLLFFRCLFFVFSLPFSVNVLSRWLLREFH